MRQHTVPKAYLKEFAELHGNEYYCHAFDKQSGNLFQTNIRNISVEKDFYTLNLLEDKYAWEHFYSEQIEPLIPTTIGKIISVCDCILLRNRSLILDSETKNNLALLIVSQLYRGLSARKYVEDISQEIVPTLLEELRGTLPNGSTWEAELNDFYPSDDLLKVSYADVAINTERQKKILILLLNKCWVLYKISGDNEFITSDNPVIIYNTQSQEYLPFKTGLAYPTSILYYPLSSKILLCLYSKEYMLGAINTLDGRIVYLDSKKEQKFIHGVNDLQLQQCERFTYAKSIANKKPTER